MVKKKKSQAQKRKQERELEQKEMRKISGGYAHDRADSADPDAVTMIRRKKL